jgi:hypothetical protein
MKNDLSIFLGIGLMCFSASSAGQQAPGQYDALTADLSKDWRWFATRSNSGAPESTLRLSMSKSVSLSKNDHA